MSITITIAGPKGVGKSIVAWAIRRALTVLGLAEVKVIDNDPTVIGTLSVSEDAMYARWHAWARNANLMHTPVVIDVDPTAPSSPVPDVVPMPAAEMPILAVRKATA